MAGWWNGHRRILSIMQRRPPCLISLVKLAQTRARFHWSILVAGLYTMLFLDKMTNIYIQLWSKNIDFHLIGVHSSLQTMQNLGTGTD